MLNLSLVPSLETPSATTRLANSRSPDPCGPDTSTTNTTSFTGGLFSGAGIGGMTIAMNVPFRCDWRCMSTRKSRSSDPNVARRWKSLRTDWRSVLVDTMQRRGDSLTVVMWCEGEKIPPTRRDILKRTMTSNSPTGPSANRSPSRGTTNSSSSVVTRSGFL